MKTVNFNLGQISVINPATFATINADSQGVRFSKSKAVYIKQIILTLVALESNIPKTAYFVGYIGLTGGGSYNVNFKDVDLVDDPSTSNPYADRFEMVANNTNSFKYDLRTYIPAGVEIFINGNVYLTVAPAGTTDILLFCTINYEEV